jgi:hypothetical protein
MPGVGMKTCTKIADPVLEKLRKKDESASSSWRTYCYFRTLKRTMQTTKGDEDLVLVHKNLRLKHLEHDEPSEA